MQQVSQLLLHIATATTTPGHHCKSMLVGLDLLHTLQLIPNCTTVQLYCCAAVTNIIVQCSLYWTYVLHGHHRKRIRRSRWPDKDTHTHLGVYDGLILKHLHIAPPEKEHVDAI